MTRRCYECNSEMYEQDCINGALALDRAYEENPQFAGWVNIESKNDDYFFVQPRDKEIIQELEIELDTIIENSPIVCRPCVNKAVKDFKESSTNDNLPTLETRPDLYLINRAKRLAKLVQLKAPSLIIDNEFRLVGQAVEVYLKKYPPNPLDEDK